MPASNASKRLARRRSSGRRLHWSGPPPALHSAGFTFAWAPDILRTPSRGIDHAAAIAPARAGRLRWRVNPRPPRHNCKSRLALGATLRRRHTPAQGGMTAPPPERRRHRRAVALASRIPSGSAQDGRLTNVFRQFGPRQRRDPGVFGPEVRPPLTSWLRCCGPPLAASLGVSRRSSSPHA